MGYPRKKNQVRIFVSDNFITLSFRATYCSERTVTVDLIVMAEIIKMINLTSAELDGHREAVTCGQLTQDQKECQQRTRSRQSLEVSKQSENSSDEDTLGGRIRRKSFNVFNRSGSVRKQIKSSLKPKPTQTMTTKVVVETRFLNHSSLQFRVQPLTFRDDAAPCMI